MGSPNSILVYDDLGIILRENAIQSSKSLQRGHPYTQARSIFTPDVNFRYGRQATLPQPLEKKHRLLISCKLFRMDFITSQVLGE